MLQSLKNSVLRNPIILQKGLQLFSYSQNFTGKSKSYIKPSLYTRGYATKNGVHKVNNAQKNSNSNSVKSNTGKRNSSFFSKIRNLFYGNTVSKHNALQDQVLQNEKLVFVPPTTSIRRMPDISEASSIQYMSDKFEDCQEYKSLCQAITEENTETIIQFFLTSSNTQLKERISKKLMMPDNWHLLKHMQNIPPQLILLALERFPELLQNVRGDKLLSELLKKTPESASQFIEIAKQNITQLGSENYIVHTTAAFLRELINYDTQIAHKVFPLLMERFPKLLKENPYFTPLELFLQLLQKSPQYADQFIAIVKDNFAVLWKRLGNNASRVPEFLIGMLKQYPISASQFTEATVKYSSLLDTRNQYKFLGTLAKTDQNCAFLLVPLAIENCKELTTNGCTWHEGEFLKNIIQNQSAKAHPQYKLLVEKHKLLVEKIFNNSTLKNLFCPAEFCAICTLLYPNFDGFSEYYKQPNSFDIRDIIRRCFLLNQIQKTSKNQINFPVMQSTNHIRYNVMRGMRRDIMSKIDTEPNFRCMINNVLEKEFALQKDYYTFFHGQKWKFDFFERWFTKLWSIKNKKNCNEYIFPHVEKPIENFSAEENLRKKMLRNGCQIAGDFSLYCDRVAGNYNFYRNRLQFLNHGLFANNDKPGSNSLCYILLNSNGGGTNFDTDFDDDTLVLKNIFSYFDFTNVYDQYKHQLEALRQEHERLTEYGNLLLFAIPKGEIKRLVYLTEDWGFRKEIHIDGIGNTTDIEVILKILRKNPKAINKGNSDRLEFGYVKTWDLGLNPESGVKILPYNAVAAALWKAYREKENELFEQIHQSIIEQIHQGVIN